MALTATTLAAACAIGDTTVNVTSATGFAAGNYLRVDNEVMQQVGAANGTIITVRRGIEGTHTAAHVASVDIVTGLPSDFPDPGSGRDVAIDPASMPATATYSADGAISIPTSNKDVIVKLIKWSAAAMTLAAPATSQNGMRMTITSESAFAHTVTYTAGFYGDTTSSDVATFAAKVGASMTILAMNGKWGVVALANVTLA